MWCLKNRGKTMVRLRWMASRMVSRKPLNWLLGPKGLMLSRNLSFLRMISGSIFSSEGFSPCGPSFSCFGNALGARI